MRLLLTYILCFVASAGMAQGTGVIQEMNTSSMVRRLITRDGFLPPAGNTLPLSPNLLNFNASANGAIFYCHCPADTTLRGMYYWNVNRWVRFGVDLTGGDSSVLGNTIDSTGQPQSRPLFSGRNRRIASSPLFLFDSANSKLVINSPNVSIGTPATKLYVNGRVVTGPLNAVSLQLTNPGLAADTVGQSLMVMDASGIARPLANAWSYIGLPYTYQPNRYLNAYGSFAPLHTDSIAEGSKQFFTQQRARESLSAGSGISYNPATGVIATSGGSGGVSIVGPFSASSQPNGASISSTTITFGPADATNPGMVSTGAQTWAGQKTFTDIISTRLSSGPSLNTGNASLYFRDGGAAGRIGIGKELTSMHLFVPTDFSSFRWYGGGDFNSGAADWMTLTSAQLSLGTGVSLSLNEILRTRLAGGGSLNAATPAVYFRDGGTGGRTGIGKDLTSMHFFVPTDFSVFRWYGGGDFNTGASNWMALDATGMALFGSNTSSSIFTVNSSTRGSLPIPRMTQTQRNAISSPAIGLHVYQTDGTEGVYVFKSTGWQFAY